MIPKNRLHLESRVIAAAEKALTQRHYVSALDVLKDIGWLQEIHVSDWRRGRIDYLERVIQTNLKKISLAMKIFRSWAMQKGLKASETAYLARTAGPRRDLQFSKSGDPAIERAYRTHYVSPALSERKRERLKEKMNQPPELVVFWTRSDSQCSSCKVDLPNGNFLLMEGEQPLCLACARLDHLIYLPSGDARLTRQAKQYSTRSAVVVRFSPARKRYERQGILVENEALERASRISANAINITT